MVVTPWGYSVESLEPILTVDAFRELSPGLSSSDARVQAAIDGVTAAVRDWCGWHVAPSLECEWTGEADGRVLVLPAMGVTAVHSVSGDGSASCGFEWKPSGLVRLDAGHRFSDSWRGATCAYTAGFDPSAVAHVVAQVAANMLAASPGVAGERAGGVDITYNQTGAGVTGGVSLLDRDKALLAPYRLARAW